LQIKKEFQDKASKFDNLINCSDFSQKDEDCFTSFSVANSKPLFITDPNEQQANMKLENADELSYAHGSAWNCNESSSEVTDVVKHYSTNNEGEQRAAVSITGDGIQIHSTQNTPYIEGEERHRNVLSMGTPHSGTLPAFKNVVTLYKIPQIKVKMKERSINLNSNFDGKSMKYVKELCNMNQNSKKQYTCHLCFQSYAGRSGLWQHLQKHSGRQYVCSVCNKHFTRGNILKHHERTHSEVSSGITCPVCKKTFQNVMQFRRHEIDHLIDWSNAM
jgi:DNA-directed RNA polymerase subunit RPC12/RpoP